MRSPSLSHRRSRSLRLLLAAPAAGAMVLTGVLASAGSSAAAAPAWAPAGSAKIHPGVQTDTKGAQCTANFVFTRGSDVLIGQAAHCAGTGGATEIDGCDSKSLPLGTKVEVEGANRKGTLVYSSWRAMQAAGERRANTCAYNDFALVRLHRSDVDSVNPSVPFWGGPTRLDGNGTQATEKVYSYGNSALRQGITQLSPKVGTSLGVDGGGWSHNIYTVTPGIPGDSGSAVLSQNGAAVGTLSTLGVAPMPGVNGVSDLAKEVAYARNHGVSGLRLVPGNKPFSSVLPGLNL